MRLGADPETFLQDPKGNLRSVIGMINANKWNPMQIKDMAEGFTLQEDNVSLEFGVPPAASAEEFISNLNAVLAKGLEYTQGCTFSKLSCTIFPKKEMRHPAAHIFGCEPDFNAWEEKANTYPKPPHPLMRSAGGHIHVETEKNPLVVVKAMDLFLGVPSVLMDNGEERKQMYGKAGAHRVKPYGVEYRTLSNFWIFEDKLIKWAWDNSQRAVDCVFDVAVEQERILAAINGNSKTIARELVDQYQLEVV